MRSDIAVSVICFAYNHEKYIRKTLDSILMQKTDFTFEIIIRDDCSTDRTADIIREYHSKYPDIFVPIYEDENQLSKYKFIDTIAVLHRAKGKYIAYCECDDFWTDENKLQMQYEFMENNPDYIGCGHATYVLYEDGMTLKQLWRYAQQDIDANILELLSGDMPCQTATFFHKNMDFSILNNVCVTVAFDRILLLYLHTKGKFRYIDKYMSIYRTSSNSSIMANYMYSSVKSSIDHRTKLRCTYQRFNYFIADICDDGIQDMDFKISLDLKDIKMLKSDYLKDMYLNLPKKERIRIFLKSYLPHLHWPKFIRIIVTHQKQKSHTKQFELDKQKTKEMGLKF